MEDLDLLSNGGSVNVSSATVHVPLSSPSSSSPLPDMAGFHEILGKMLATDDKVSDLIFSPGRPPQVELTGDLQGVPIQGLEMLKPPQISAIVDTMLAGNDVGIETLDKKGSTDISYSVPALCRF